MIPQLNHDPSTCQACRDKGVTALPATDWSVVEPDELPGSPDLNVLEMYAHPYTVAVLVVAALLALCVAALAIRRTR